MIISDNSNNNNNDNNNQTLSEQTETLDSVLFEDMAQCLFMTSIMNYTKTLILCSQQKWLPKICDVFILYLTKFMFNLPAPPVSDRISIF